MYIFRSTPGARRVVVLFFALFLLALFLLPAQTRGLLQQASQPLAWLVSYPLEGFAGAGSRLGNLWEGYVALQDVRQENGRLRRELELLRGQNTALREAAASAKRLEGLLGFKDRSAFESIAARVIARNATNWYRALVLDKGDRDGVKMEMGVVTPAGVVGRVVKTTPHTAIVLLITDPNNAVTGLIQRTRDEGLVEGTPKGQSRMKYIPLLSSVQEGDAVVTSGLTGGFPRGLAIGVITKINKSEGELFQSADVVPEVDFSKLDEVVVITSVHDLQEEASVAQAETSAGKAVAR